MRYRKQNFRRFRLLFFFMFFVTGCSSLTASPIFKSDPTPTPIPACRADGCVKDVYLEMQGDNLWLHFDLTDKDDQVNAGEYFKFQTPISFALFLVAANGKETYLIGAEPDLSLYECYSGDDIPWANGRRGSTCGIIISAALLQTRVKVGDAIQVQIIDPLYTKEAIWMTGE